jgi:hypothetical protein
MKIDFGSQKYDLPTAITFLMAGLGIGSLVAVFLAPRAKSIAAPLPVGMHPSARTTSAV